MPPDVLIQRQVLAEPSLDLDSKTWARLTDGTPLVTAEKRGKGWIVLVHTTANTEWSNLPISGLFVQMLQRVVGLAQGVAGEDGSGVLAPVSVMDGFGRHAGRALDRRRHRGRQVRRGRHPARARRPAITAARARAARSTCRPPWRA